MSNLYSGCGNTFVIHDNRNQSLYSPTPADCARADGVIFLEKSSAADYKMRIFNCDGNETEMCGNGLRCLVRFIEHLGEKRKTLTIETAERILRAHNHGPLIAVEMGTPTEIRFDQTIELDGKKQIFHHINTGVPHAVTFTNYVPSMNLKEIGYKVRHHPAFAPAGANANFAQIEENEIITLRTYERGVEAETEACGTGACATALIASKVYGLKSPIVVRTKSKELLYISFTHKDGEFSDVTLTGPATLS